MSAVSAPQTCGNCSHAHFYEGKPYLSGRCYAEIKLPMVADASRFVTASIEDVPLSRDMDATNCPCWENKK